MADQLGMSFQPGADQGYRQQLNQSQLGPTANEALKIISMHLPSILGGRPISPDDLLRPRVGGAASLTGGGTSGLMNTPGGDLSSLARLIAQALGIGGSAPGPTITPASIPTAPGSGTGVESPSVPSLPNGGYQQPRPPFNQGSSSGGYPF